MRGKRSRLHSHCPRGVDWREGECARRILDKTGLSSALDLRATVDEAVELAREKLGAGKWQVVEA